MAINLNKSSELIRKSSSEVISNLNQKANKLLNTTKADTVEISVPKSFVNVFQSLTKKTCDHEKIISPKFNGCHGVGIYSDDKIFFSHFPPFMKGRMIESIETALENFDKNKKAQVVFVTPVSKNGTKEKAFEEYLSIILKKFNINPDIEYLTYPNRSKGATYTYTGIIDKGVLKNFISKINNTKS